MVFPTCLLVACWAQDTAANRISAMAKNLGPDSEGEEEDDQSIKLHPSFADEATCSPLAQSVLTSRIQAFAAGKPNIEQHEVRLQTCDASSTEKSFTHAYPACRSSGRALVMTWPNCSFCPRRRSSDSPWDKQFVEML